MDICFLIYKNTASIFLEKKSSLVENRKVFMLTIKVSTLVWNHTNKPAVAVRKTASADLGNPCIDVKNSFEN